MTDAPRRVELPASEETLASLRAGDEILLTGPVHTARDATHVRLVGELRRLGRLPHGLEGATLFYAGPTPPGAGRPAGAIGPTTSSRMDAWTPELLEAGVVATIGKGPRSEEVREACRRFGAVYFVTVGGAAAELARHVRSAETVTYGDLGTEALMRLELDEFPAWVAYDTIGGDLFGGRS